MLKKLSLAALIAVGSVSVASATPLTEAIKGVDLSGEIKVRFDNNNPKDKDKNSSNRWTTSGKFKFTVPVSEELKVVYQIKAEGDVYSNGNTLDPNKNEESNPKPGVEETLAYLNYSVNGLNAILGKIPVGTSVTDNNPGAGIVTSYKIVDELTVAAAWVDGVTGTVLGNVGNDIYALAALFNVEDMVKGNVWYYHTTNLVKNLYTVTLDVTPVDIVTLHMDYAAGKLDTKGADTKTYFNISAGANFEGACVQVGYAATNKKIGAVVLDGDAPISAVLPTEQQTSIADMVDTTAIYAKAGYNVNNDTNVYVAYTTIDQGKNAGNEDYSEIALGGSYKYNKKMKFSTFYSILDGKNGAKGDDNNQFRFEAKYSF